MGYAANPDKNGEENPLGWFKYDDWTDAEKELYMGYRKHNDKVMAEIGTPEQKTEYFTYNTDHPIDCELRRIFNTELFKGVTFR